MQHQIKEVQRQESALLLWQKEDKEDKVNAAACLVLLRGLPSLQNVTLQGQLYANSN